MAELIGFNEGDRIEITDVIHRVMHDVHQLRPGDVGIVVNYNKYMKFDQAVMIEQEGQLVDKKEEMFDIPMRGRDGKSRMMGPFGRMDDAHVCIVWYPKSSSGRWRSEPVAITNVEVCFDNGASKAKLRWRKVANSAVRYE